MSKLIANSILLDGLTHRTKQLKYLRETMEFMNSMLNEKTDRNVALPSVNYLCNLNLFSKYREEMIKLYNGTFGQYSDCEEIPDEIKIGQASVLDALCFGYDTTKESVSLYTMNPSLFLATYKEFDTKKIFDMNKIGGIKAQRVDILNLGDSNGVIEFNLVNHRSVIDDEEIILVPYIVVHTLMKIIATKLRQGESLGVLKDTHSVITSHFITGDRDILAHYSYNGELYKVPDFRFYPLDARFYAPIIGGSPLSTGDIGINLFQIAGIRKFNPTDLQRLVKKEENPLSDLTTRLVLLQSLNAKKDQLGSEVFEDTFLPKIPYGDKLKGLAVNVLNYKTFGKYWHALPSSGRERLISMFPEFNKTKERLDSVFNTIRVLTPEELSTPLSALLARGICLIEIVKPDGSKSSIICSNNTSILKTVYGDNYMGQMESYGVRFNHLANFYINNINSLNTSKDYYKDVYEYTNLNPDLHLTMSNIVLEGVRNGYTVDELREAIVSELYTWYDLKRRSVSDGDIILVRSLTGFVGTKTEYYKNILADRVTSIRIIE